MKEKLANEEIENYIKWSEGNKYLYNLLYTCGKNEITTLASCGGHPHRYWVPYIEIKVDENSKSKIKNILAELQNMENIKIEYSIGKDEDKLQLYGEPYNCCELFYRINKAIQSKDNANLTNQKLKEFYEQTGKLDEFKGLQNEKSSVTVCEYDSQTKEYKEFLLNQKPTLNNTLARILAKLNPFKKRNSEQNRRLQEKYGVLQTEYNPEEKNSTKKVKFYKRITPEQAVQYSKNEAKLAEFQEEVEEER